MIAYRRKSEMNNKSLKNVEKFWDKKLFGGHFIKAPYLSETFFEEYRQFRFQKEHHLNWLIDWQSAKGKDILEIGLGIGTDATRWAKYSKSFTGIDLTHEAARVTKLHLRYLGYNGQILKANAEELPFSNGRFDIVYSHGVLHHTPSIEKAFRQVHRVLKSNGLFILMLYTKDSFNYWIRIQFYFRLRFLFEMYRLRKGFEISEPWISHLINYHKTGWQYFSWNVWPHHCTDGPDCEIANIYHKSEIVQLLKDSGFMIKKMRKAHFPTNFLSQKIESILAKYVGFFMFVSAVKN
ncbi:hypothetical protein D1BOALGB6SA_2799 [Olavius sp. associated proteobacterium Delta 1]|nr:hypothetical protein D1BOALGB6SA_2799 [Olavius sp. associated proteobacterium Delta 1]